MAVPMQQTTPDIIQAERAVATSGQVHDWAHSFWACCSPFDTCCLSCWCPCILYGKTKARRNDPSLATYSIFNGNCLAWCGLACFGVQSILQCINRGDMREQFSIKGSSVGDFCGACCCPACGLVQEEKEMLLINGQANGKTQGYQAQAGGMEYKN